MTGSLFAPPGGFSVRIVDLSGAKGAEPVETVRGFGSLMHANAFARTYVRDSLERCRAPGLAPDKVLATWFAFGEDAVVEETPGQEGGGWRSATEVRDFAAQPATVEERNWRALDPRRHGGEPDEDDDEGRRDGDDDGEAEDGGGLPG